jgi:hypothetical protein
MTTVAQLPSYQVAVLSPFDGSVQAIFDPATFYDLRYSRLLNDVGLLTLTLSYSNKYRQAFQTDSFIEVSRTNPVTGVLTLEDTFLARSFNRFRAGNEEKYVVSAWHLNDLVKRRVVDPNDDPAAAGGFSTYAGAADTVIYQYAYYNMGPGASAARQIPNLTIPVPPGTGLGVGYRLQYDDLFKVVFQDATARGQTDFVIRRTSGANLELDIGVIGTDKRQSSNYPFHSWLGLDPKRGNLTDPNLLIDRKAEMNVAYTLGQGQATARQLSIVAGDQAGDSPFNRIEFVVNASSVVKGDTTGLLTMARTELKKNALVKTFSFKSLGIEAGNAYQNDWVIGDLITVSYDEQSFDLRIYGVEVFISQAGEVITPKINII